MIIHSGKAILFLLVTALITSCKYNITGDPEPNKFPETYMVTDTIIRSGDNRLVSQISINWWGNDPDGYVAGFEMSSDLLNWTFTTVQDTIITVNIPEGQDTFDFSFYIRAVDNEGARDQTPASLVYPVKNSSPGVVFTYGSGSSASPSHNPVSSFPILKFNWAASDPDGPDNLSHLELYWNDTTNQPVELDKIFSSAIFEGVDLTGNLTNVKVYPGSSIIPLPAQMPGMKLNDSNILYIRAVDKVGAKSPFAASYSIFVRKPSSNLLLVNAYSTNILFREQFYTTNLNQTGITNFDIIRVNEVLNNNYTGLSADNLTQAKVFALFDAMIWFGSDAPYTLALAQRTTDLFFQKGGKMFAAVNFSSSVDEQAAFLDFTPIDSLVNPPPGSVFRLNGPPDTAGALVIPLLAGWPALRSDRIVSSARPFYEKFGTIPMYDAEITQSSAQGATLWPGKSTVMAKRLKNGKSQFIISSLELQNLVGNNNMDSLFIKLFREELEL